MANHRKPFISIFHVTATAAAHFCFLSHQAELKSKKAAESFALCIEKYNRVGGEFEQKMSESSQVSSSPSGQNRKPLPACVTAFLMTLSSLLSTLPPDKCANVLLFVLYKKTKKKPKMEALTLPNPRCPPTPSPAHPAHSYSTHVTASTLPWLPAPFLCES